MPREIVSSIFKYGIWNSLTFVDVHAIFALFGLALLIWPSVYSCLENLILALEFVLKLILEFACLVLGVDFHGPLAILDNLQLLL